MVYIKCKVIANFHLCPFRQSEQTNWRIHFIENIFTSRCIHPGGNFLKCRVHACIFSSKNFWEN